MEPVHFIWLGPPPTALDKAFATPNRVAQECGARHVRFWCLDAESARFRAHLETGIQIKTLGEIEQARLPIGRSLQARAFDVIHTMCRYQAPISAKDLLSYLILHTYGGYFLDTTTRIVNPGSLAPDAWALGVDGRPIAKALSQRHRSVRVVYVGGATISHLHWILTPRAIETGDDPSYDNAIDLPQIDIWAMYSPAGHKAYASAILSYVERCAVLGINSSNSPQNDRGVAGHRILKMIADPANAQAVDTARKHRNELIGNLAVHALYDGLLDGIGRRGNPAAEIRNSGFKAKAYVPPVVQPNQPRTDIVPELGLLKQYTGSWRA